MHVGILAGGPPALKLIPRTLGVVIGSPNAGICFDGIYSIGWDYDTPYVGKLWPSRRTIRRYRAYSSSNGWDHASQPAIVGFKLQGSNDTTTGLDGTWVDLHSTTRDDPWNSQDVLDVTSGIDLSTAYLAHRLYLRCTNYDGISIGQLSLSVAELEFYDYSYV